MSQIFREADPWHDPNRMHPTFRRKEFVDNQAVAAVSRMEEKPGVKLSTVYDLKPAPVPTKWDTNYDPQHPRADWSGSYKIDERAHFSGHRSMQSGISQERDGFVSVEEQPMWTCKRRGVTNGLATTPGLIGGIGPEDAADTYRSVARRQSELDSTHRDQYTLAKRNLASGKKLLQNPAQALSNSHNGNRENRGNGGDRVTFADKDYEQQAYDEYIANAQQESPAKSKYDNLVGFRAPPQTKSLIGGLADTLVSSVSVSTSLPGHFVPQKDRKDLSVSKPIPGYTGYRRSGM